jgi:quercetin dioxygenase-like cupin family protein
MNHKGHKDTGNIFMSFYFPTASELGRHTIFPGVVIETCPAETMMISVVDLEPHAIVAEHSHYHEQVGMLLEGEMTFTIGGERKVVKPGDMWRIPGNMPHKVENGEKRSRAIDIFCPVREEYR